MLYNCPRLNCLLENQKKGLLGEKIAKEDYIQNGFKIVSTTIGSDFIAYKNVDGKKYEEYVEVKTGNARQSLTQKRKMKELRRIGINYTIYRVTEKFLSYYVSDNGDYRKKQSKVDPLQTDKSRFDQSTRNISEPADIVRQNSTRKMYMLQDTSTTVMQPNGTLHHSEFMSGIDIKSRKYCSKLIEITTSKFQEENPNV
jgi:hypothetical protein